MNEQINGIRAGGMYNHLLLDRYTISVENMRRLPTHRLCGTVMLCWGHAVNSDLGPSVLWVLVRAIR